MQDGACGCEGAVAATNTVADDLRGDRDVCSAAGAGPATEPCGCAAPIVDDTLNWVNCTTAGDYGEVYLRTEIAVAGRFEVQSLSGSGLVPHPDFGFAPADDNLGAYPDGRRYRREDWNRSSNGVESRGQRLLERRATPPRPREAPAWPSRKRQVLAELAAMPIAESVSLLLFVEDGLAEQLPIPARSLRGAAMTRHGRSDHLTPLAKQRGRELARLRLAALHPIAELATGLGGVARVHRVVGRGCVRVDIPTDRVERLLADPRVHDVTWFGGVVVPDGPSTNYLCGFPGPAPRPDPKIDQASTCLAANDVYQDAANATVGAYAYLDNAYHGGNISGGLASWTECFGLLSAAKTITLEDGSTETAVASYGYCENLSIAIVDGNDQLYPLHPAFTAPYSTDSRIRYFVDSWSIRTPAEFSTITLPAVGNHGTKCAGVVMGNITDEQDVNVSTASGQDARSGMARRAVGFMSSRDLSLTLGLVSDIDLDLLEEEATPIDGVDIVSCSLSYHTISETCPLEDETRGLDHWSEAVVWAYLNDGIVTVKSAGNTHGKAAACNWPWVDSQVNAPGASPAVVSVGSASNKDQTAFATQRLPALTSDSSGDHTGDGRAYPSLIAEHFACGCACACSCGSYTYGDQGATSGATPRVAGAFVLFKHWYLEHHGPEFANVPGRLIANVLNFADGYGEESRTSTVRVDAPTQGWGLGRLRMRLFESKPDGMSGDWYRGTTSLVLSEGESEEIQLAGEDEVPADVRRLRITLWWLEVNTGAGEEKAKIIADLWNDTGRIQRQATKTDCTLRIQYDCEDLHYGWSPRGPLRLLVSAPSVPRALRYGSWDTRTVYVSWFWETGADTSTIVCNGAPASMCGTGTAGTSR